jgi:hypothetical protein
MKIVNVYFIQSFTVLFALKVKLSSWNTGRVYIIDEKDVLNPLGTICLGVHPDPLKVSFKI